MKNTDKAKELLYSYSDQFKSLLKQEIMDRIIYDEGLDYERNIESNLYGSFFTIYSNYELKELYNINEGNEDKLYLCISDEYNYFFELDVEYNEESNTLSVSLDGTGANLDYTQCYNIYQCLWFLNSDNGEIENVYDNTADITVSNFYDFEIELKK